MNIEKKEDLIEQYEDAAFALMMSNYAEQEGNRLLQEFEEAKARGEVPAVPEELDKKCRQLIHKAYQKERVKARTKKALCFAGKTAAAWFVVIGLCTTLIVSVEALRTPVVNFIIEQHDKFTTITFGKDSTSPSSQPTTDSHANFFVETPFDGIVPLEYSLSQYNTRDDGTFIAIYKNENGESVIISSTIGNGAINLDTEDSTANPIDIGHHVGYFVQKGTELSIVWYEEAHNISYKIRTTAMMFSEFWDMAEQFAYSNKGD